MSTIVLFLSFELFFEPLRDNPSFWPSVIVSLLVAYAGSPLVIRLASPDRKTQQGPRATVTSLLVGMGLVAVFALAWRDAIVFLFVYLLSAPVGVPVAYAIARWGATDPTS